MLCISPIECGLLLLSLSSTLLTTSAIYNNLEPLISHSGPSTDDGRQLSIGPEQLFKMRSKRGSSSYYSNGQYEWSLLVNPGPPDNYMRKWITQEHNRYRRMVPATDMRMLTWSDSLAASAQRHANRCDFRHSRDRVNVGENIWVAPYANYSDAISRWFMEVHNPWCQCNHAYKHCCGHYVQVVWAKTSEIGCGYAQCRDVWGVQGRGHRYTFVCHYNPQGNTVFVTGNGQLYSVPAFTFASGHKGRCSECPNDAQSCWDGLCYDGYSTRIR